MGIFEAGARSWRRYWWLRIWCVYGMAILCAHDEAVKEIWSRKVWTLLAVFRLSGRFEQKEGRGPSVLSEGRG